MSDTGNRQKSSVKTGRSSVGAKEQQSSRPPLARRSVSAKEDSFNYDIAFDEDASEMPTSQNQLRRRRLKIQKSTDSADASGASSGPDSDTATNSFKTIWKKAINKLIRRRRRSTDDTKLSPTSSNTNAEEAGEVDPVYTFLKLTSGKPREGVSVIPGDDHYCCAKTAQDIGVVANDAAAKSDPSRCQCPCHLPERLQSVHNAWLRSFASKKT